MLIVFAIYLSVSVVAFATFAWDKRAAQRGRRRIPERNLHLLELLGGWPGAILAMRTLRHKSSKPSYQIILFLIVFLHAAAWAAFLLWRR